MSSHLKELKAIRTSLIFRLWKAKDFILTDKEALFFLERSRQGLIQFRKQSSKYDNIATETMRRLVYDRVGVSTWREFAELRKHELVKSVLTVEEKVIIHKVAVNIHRATGHSINKIRAIALDKILRGKTRSMKPWLKTGGVMGKEVDRLFQTFLGEGHE